MRLLDRAMLARGVAASTLLAALLNISPLIMGERDAEPVLVAQLAAEDTISLEREHYSGLISREYSISHGMAADIVDIVWARSQQHGVDPLLVLAVISTESSFRPHVVSSAGAVGLMQVMPDVHSDLVQEVVKSTGRKHVNPKEALRDPVINIEAGIRVLKMYQKASKGNLREALLRYNGSLHLKQSRYDRKVMQNFNQLSSSL
jgi:soluble lytic murein transglycosylase-like protein